MTPSSLLAPLNFAWRYPVTAAASFPGANPAWGWLPADFMGLTVQGLQESFCRSLRRRIFSSCLASGILAGSRMCFCLQYLSSLWLEMTGGVEHLTWGTHPWMEIIFIGQGTENTIHSASPESHRHEVIRRLNSCQGSATERQRGRGDGK